MTRGPWQRDMHLAPAFPRSRGSAHAGCPRWALPSAQLHLASAGTAGQVRSGDPALRPQTQQWSRTDLQGPLGPGQSGGGGAWLCLGSFGVKRWGGVAPFLTSSTFVPFQGLFCARGGETLRGGFSSWEAAVGRVGVPGLE